MVKFTAVSCVLLFPLILVRVKCLPSSPIVGGTSAYEGQFPHQISLRRFGLHVCGGSIISRNFVITAAHCVGNWKQSVFSCYSPSDYNIRAGSIDRLKGGVLASIAEILLHKNYENFINDIALLTLSEPLIFSNNIQAIDLAIGDTTEGSSVTIIGWGWTKDYGDLPPILQWSTLTALSRSTCNETYVDSVAILCLGHEKGNGACNYDSGSAAILNGELVGVANFIYSACGSHFPDVYANVHYHVDWIRKHSDL